MKVKIKKLNEKAIIPFYAKKGDAGLDLTSIGFEKTERYIEHGTGLAVEIPEGYVGLLFPRSSITNKALLLKNSVGVIDSSYRGEIKIRFEDLKKDYFEQYIAGERVAQLIIMPYPIIEFEEVNDFTKTERGDGGFGSTNN